MNLLKSALLISIACQSFSTLSAEDKMRSYDIRHNSPAAIWSEANPLGNGTLGAMVRGGVKDEMIQLNEDTFWSGEPKPTLDGKKHLAILDQVRTLIYEGKHQAATNLGQANMLGEYGQSFIPMGKLKLNMPNIVTAKVTGYDRVLNLNNALSTTKFTHGGVDYTRTVFISHPDKVLVLQLTASQPGSISLNVTLDSVIKHTLNVKSGAPNRLWMLGNAPVHADADYVRGAKIIYEDGKGTRFATLVQVDRQGGTSTTSNNIISVVNANSVTIKLTAATSFNGFDKSPSSEGKDEKRIAETTLNKIKDDSVKALYTRHQADYSALFSKVDIKLGGDTDKQGQAVSQRTRGHYNVADHDLDELFYQFGRYLLISSSRVGSQPANLQGIWNEKLIANWSSNWTMNCNAQFNYIGVGAAGLADLGEPMQRLVHEASIDGAKVAKSWYGSKGWVFHHNIDLWRRANPSAGNVMWATFPLSGAWTMVELFDIWKFNYRTTELEKLWPLIKGNVEFWLGNLVTDPDSGLRVSCPDIYFENQGYKPAGSKGGTVLLCSAPVSSTIIIRQSFLDIIEAAKILKRSNDPVVTQAMAMLKKMPKIEIGPNGEIRQWDRDPKNEWKEGDKTQLLVMVGAIYANQIHPRTSPKLAKALQLMLSRRGSGFHGQGSWRAAFPANSYARLGMGNQFLQVLSGHYRRLINANLTTRFNNKADWQIDCNLGVMGAIQECLVQSHAGEIELLPALPDAWKAKGFVKEIAVRGGGTVSFSWKNGIVTDWKLSGLKGQSVKVRVNGKLQLAKK